MQYCFCRNQGAPLLLDLGLLLILLYSAIPYHTYQRLLQPDNHHTFPSFRQTEQTNQPGYSIRTAYTCQGCRSNVGRGENAPTPWLKLSQQIHPDFHQESPWTPMPQLSLVCCVHCTLLNSICLQLTYFIFLFALCLFFTRNK